MSPHTYTLLILLLYLCRYMNPQASELATRRPPLFYGELHVPNLISSRPRSALRQGKGPARLIDRMWSWEHSGVRRDKTTSGKLLTVEVPPEFSDPEALRDGIKLETALLSLEGYFLNTVANHELLLSSFLEVSPNLLGFVWAEIDDATATRMADCVFRTFPTEPGEFEDSLARKILAYISHYFSSLSYPSGNLAECQRAVELARPLMRAISTLDFPREHVIDGRADDKRGAGRSLPKRPTQRDNKRANRAKRLSSVDPAPFDAIGVTVPQSAEEAYQLGQEVLGEQKAILAHYFETLRKPELKLVFKYAYIPQQPAVKSISDVGSQVTESLDAAPTTSQTPAAYPAVQPLKAALYFESAEGFGAWRIWMSQRACKDMRSAKRKNAKMFKIVIKKIKELSHGHFSDDNQKHLAGNESEIPIFEAKMTRDTRLIYQIDCVRDYDTEMEMQVLRIFGIYTHAEIDRRFWDAVGRQYANGGKEYRRRCIYRNTTAHAENVILPGVFPSENVPSTQPDAPLLPGLSDEMKEQLHSLLVLEKFVNFDQDLMNNIEADEESSHVFDMSPEEQGIVKHVGSCFVIGRSGTGKTTTMLFKMLGIEQAWNDIPESVAGGISRPRQIFVTQSRVLAEKVRESFYKLLHSHEGVKNNSTLNGHIVENRAAQYMFDHDEEELWRDDLPKQFTQLEGRHYPLFLSSDRLFRLLEADGIESMGAKEFYTQIQDDQATSEVLSSDYMRQRREHFVTYDLFLEAYWPHFPQHLTKSLDPTLVFAEIIGVIKGSEQTLASNSGHMDRAEYLAMSHRTRAMFSHQREVVYNLFEVYTKLKSSLRDYDAADRTHSILRYLRQPDTVLPTVHYLYVDEVQDNMIIDALVLRLICGNPNGLFWGGDTAQTISAGSSFRFDDLKAFMHRIETSSKSEKLSTAPPRLFQLTRNYRSHAGIANCAQTIVKVITRFWPYDIDVLGDEKGVVDGPKPLFFTGWDLDTLRFEQFLFGAADSRVEFGARQCILVRDDAALEALQSEIGKVGIIMTLYDSKGLEFDDVLLYDFFDESLCTMSQWRVLLNFLPGETGIKCPSFDENVHNGLCRELKSLYVAVTRARKHLWIADRSEKAEVMRMIWDSRDQVDHNPPDSGISILAATSSAEEWLDTANQLFKNKKYAQAMHAYEYAQDWHRRNIAEAYYLRMQAKRPAANSAALSEQTNLYAKAARAFWKLAEAADSAAEESKVFYRLSAECHHDAKEDRLAAAAYELAEHYSLSASHYRAAEEFDDAVRVIRTYEPQVERSVAENIIDIAKLYYLNDGSNQKTFALFESDDEALPFLDEYGFSLAKAQLLETRCRYREAAEVYAEEGLFSKATSLCLMEQPSQERERRAADYLLNALWLIYSLGALPPSTDPEPQKLFEFAGKLELTALTEIQRDQFDMFNYIRAMDTSQLRRLGWVFYSHHHNIAASILCFDHRFDKPPILRLMTALEISTALNDFLLYAETLQKLGAEKFPDSNKDLRCLLAFSESRSTNDLFFVPAGSLIHSEADSYSFRLLTPSSSGFNLVREDLMELSSLVLQRRLQDRVKAMDLLSRIQPIEPCSRFPEQCGKDSRPCPQLHVKDTYTYTLRIVIHLLRILIYHTLWGLESYKRRRRPHSLLLMNLYEAVNPSSFTLGSPVNTEWSRISPKARHIVLQWVCESMFALKLDLERPEPHPFFLTSIFQLFFLYQWATDSVTVPPYLCKVPWAIANSGPEWLMRSGKEAYVILNVLDFISIRNDMALSKAVLLLRHILDKKVPIDVTILCDTLDKLCSLIIVAHRLRSRFSLHGVTLPHSWFQFAIKLGDRVIDVLDSQRLGSLSYFAVLMMQLLERLSSGVHADHILSGESSKFMMKDQRIRGIFLERICQAIALFGFNVPDESVREICLRSLHVMQWQPNRENIKEQRYTTVRNWAEMARVIGDCLSKSPLDFLVTLHGSVNAPHVAVPHARQMKITDLFPMARAAAPSSGKQAITTSFDQIAVERVSHDEPKSLVADAIAGQAVEEEEAEPPAMSPTVQETPDSALFSQEELTAGRTIWNAYQRYRKGRNSKDNNMDILRSQVYAACLEASRHITWSQHSYRYLFLGPFPHLYACLQSVYAYARSERKAAQARLRKVDHLMLEEARGKIDQTNNFMRKTERLLKPLHPYSPVHVKEDKASLRALTKEVDGLIAEVPNAISSEWQADLRLARAGILVPSTTKNPAKPTLNVDDLDPVF